MSNVKLMEMAKQMKTQGDVLYESVKYVEEVAREVRKTRDEVMKVGSFLIDFYNEYREHDALTMGQVKELKEAQHEVTSAITKILCPRLPESRKRGSEYLIEWVKVNRGLWSIFKRNVNGVSVPYDRTPKVKFEQALKYIKCLTVADYLAYRDERWGDIKEFHFEQPLDNEKITIEKVIGNTKPKLTLIEG
ncbi:hypothetical protein KDN24_06315 [Bacillus sp. Bva_UNVM-123]|uniref:hypothetical protein n=1 Tax=Bacillus sp. Bva_UNVM-123 TaxID=2829798 RepID=UPI00391F78B2